MVLNYLQTFNINCQNLFVYGSKIFIHIKKSIKSVHKVSLHLARDNKDAIKSQMLFPERRALVEFMLFN